MPRHVDSQARRAEVAAAVWRVVLRGGLHRATVRAVAAEAGLSTGSLRHYFADQSGLKDYAYELIAARVEERLAAVDMDAPIRERVESIMWAMLPVTPDQVGEEQVRLAYLVESRSDPALAELLRAERRESESLTREAIVALRDAGQADPRIDVDAATVELLALLDGLSQAAALFPDAMTSERLVAAVRRWLDGLADGTAS